MPRRGLLVMMHGSGSKTLSASYVANASSGTGTDNYTFSGVPLGTAATDRRIVVVVSSRKVGAASTVSAITIGGVTATIDVEKWYTYTNSTMTAIAHAHVPTGATGDVVVAFGASMLRMGLGIYRITGGALAVAATGSTGVNGGVDLTMNAGTLDTSAGGALIAGVAWGVVTSNILNSFTGVTENYEIDAGSSYLRVAGGSVAATGSGVEVTARGTGISSESSLAAVAYQGV